MFWVEKQLVAKVTHFFGKISVAVLEVSADLKVGDKIYVETSEPFEQEVESIQVDKENIQEAKPGQLIALKLNGKARPGDMVYKVVA